MTDIPTEALEAAARAIAVRAHSKRHGQLCPCWTKGAPIGECNCWILTRARGDATAAAPHLIAEGRRQRDAELIEEWAVERTDWRAQGISKIVECVDVDEALRYRRTAVNNLAVIRRQVTKWEEIAVVE